MQDLYDFEPNPLQVIIDNCDGAIATYRKPIFACWCTASFNGGVMLIRVLELWAEQPWYWATNITLICLVVHVMNSIWLYRTLRKAKRQIQPWIKLRQSCFNAMKSRSYTAVEFHLDQIAAAYRQLEKS